MPSREGVERSCAKEEALLDLEEHLVVVRHEDRVLRSFLLLGTVDDVRPVVGHDGRKLRVDQRSAEHFRAQIEGVIVDRRGYLLTRKRVVPDVQTLLAVLGQVKLEEA